MSRNLRYRLAGFKYKYVLVLAWVGFSAAVWFGFSGTAAATHCLTATYCPPTSTFPDHRTLPWGGGNLRIYVAKPNGTTITDNIPSSEFKVFYNGSAAGMKTITIAEGCTNLPNDLGDTRIRAEVMTYDATGTILTAPIVVEDSTTGSACSSGDLNLTFNGTLLAPQTAIYGSNFQIAVVRVTLLGAVGKKYFYIDAPGAQVTMNELGIVDSTSPAAPTAWPTALGEGIDPLVGSSSQHYVFHVQVPCGYKAKYGNTFFIKWRDADWNTAIQDDQIYLDIYNKALGPTDVLSVRGSAVGGNEEYSYYEYTFQNDGDLIQLAWYFIAYANGMQIYLPFSEMQQEITDPLVCNPPAPTPTPTPGGPPPGPNDVSCSVVIPPTVLAGASFKADFTITNNTGSPIDPASNYYLGADFSGANTVNYLAPNAATNARINWPGAIPDGTTSPTFSYFFNANSPAGPGTQNESSPPGLPLPNIIHRFDWRLVQGLTWFGPPCTASFEVTGGVPVVSCNVIVNPINPSPGQTVDVTITVTNLSTSGNVTNSANPLIVSISNGIRPSAQLNYSDPVGPGGGTGTATLSGISFGGATSFVINASISASGITSTCPETIRVSAKPYLKFFGADVNAGGKFNDATTNTACAYEGGHAGTGIKTFARNNNPSGTYYGSSVEFAAFSMAEIEGSNTEEYGFYSASVRRSGQEGLYLTFANDDPSVTNPPLAWHGTWWGGGFSTSPRCIEDYYNTTRLPGVIPMMGSVLELDKNTGNGIQDTGQYQVNGLVRLTNTSGAQFNSRVTLYVDGDIFIEDNIFYDTNFTAGIPYLTIIANGNIYISPSVTNIDALLIAQPTNLDGSTGGRVYTCAKRIGINFLPFSDVELVSACVNKLTIHGAIIAQQIRFLRTNGTVNFASTPELAGSPGAAEVIDMSPEFYMGTPNFKPRSSNGAPTYNAIQTLPPVF